MPIKEAGEPFDQTQWRPWQCYPPTALAHDPWWYPYAWGLIEIKRQGSEHTDVVQPGELPPEFNVYDLYWRPWPVVHPVFDGP